MRLQRTRALLCCALLFGGLGCKVTADDIEYWKGTVKGPGKIVAVMLSDNYPLDLRTKAALALVEMDRQDVDGVAELQRAVQRLDDTTRPQLIDGMVGGLEELMRGGDTATDADGPPPGQVRAKDAAYLLITHAEGQTRTRLMNAVVDWYVADFNGRNLAGNYSAEQIIRSLGAPAASKLVDALNPEMPQPALVKLAELIAQLGDDSAKERAAARLVEIEEHMEGDEFLDWLKGQVREAMEAQQMEIQEERVASIAAINRENFINDGALPAMKHLARQEVVAARLLAIAQTSSDNAAITERRKRALQAMEGAATREHLEPLLALALSDQSPIAVRDYAFDRVGDIRAPEAIPRMWPLVQRPETDNARVRWRAGEMVLAIGGPDVVREFFEKLPTAEEIEYEPEELEGYATRMSQMSPPPTNLVRGQLSSPDWWDKVIALRYFERRGTESDVRQMQRLRRDRTAVAGENWEQLEIENVGDVAEAAIEGLRERLSGGGDDEEDGDSTEEGGGSE